MVMKSTRYLCLGLHKGALQAHQIGNFEARYTVKLSNQKTVGMANMLLLNAIVFDMLVPSETFKLRHNIPNGKRNIFTLNEDFIFNIITFRDKGEPTYIIITCVDIQLISTNLSKQYTNWSGLNLMVAGAHKFIQLIDLANAIELHKKEVLESVRKYGQPNSRELS
ncbi:hypothetical protein SUGI_0400840 [Cryptomeria japonica]|nr:hypothetical protein SUGI_0400840 [Cryptomeria japonica]